MKKVLTYLVATATILSTNVALAAAGAVPDASDRITNFGRSVSAGGDLVYTIIGVAGVAFLLMGVLGFIKYSKDTDRESWVPPLILTIAGGVLSAFGGYQAIMAGTATGEEVDTSTGTFDAIDK